MTHVGYIHAVTEQAYNCPPGCDTEVYAYHYEKGARIVRAYLKPEQASSVTEQQSVLRAQRVARFILLTQATNMEVAA